MKADILAALTSAISAALSAVGESILYQQQGADPVSVTGIWHEVGAGGVSATLWVQASSLPAGYSKRDRVLRGEKRYEVDGFSSDANAASVTTVPHPDDAGCLYLVLREVVN